MIIDLARRLEIDKYIAIYAAGDHYTINERRRKQSVNALRELIASHANAKTLLDVGCYGVWMNCVSDIFDLDCMGVDPVSSLAGEKVKTALATDLPFKDSSFDLVTCLDVMEHLIPEDTIPALNEIKRVMKNGAIITVNNNPSCYRGIGYTELHINIKSYGEWGIVFSDVFGSVRMLNNTGNNRVFIV